MTPPLYADTWFTIGSHWLIYIFWYGHRGWKSRHYIRGHESVKRKPETSLKKKRKCFWKNPHLRFKQAKKQTKQFLHLNVKNLTWKNVRLVSLLSKKRKNSDYLKAVNVVTLVAMVPNKVGILISLFFSLSEFAYNTIKWTVAQNVNLLTKKTSMTEHYCPLVFWSEKDRINNIKIWKLHLWCCLNLDGGKLSWFM